jgi:hypothetical protein
MERLALLLGISFLLTVTGRLLRRHYGHVPAGLTLLFMLINIGLGVPAMFLFVFSGEMNIGTVISKVFFSFVVLFIPLYDASQLTAGMLSGGLVNSLYWTRSFNPLPSACGRARHRAANADITGAVREYRRYYAEAPKNPAPLFAAAGLLEQYARYPEAGSLYRDIMRDFEKKNTVWCEAAYRLAVLCEQRLQKEKEAGRLYRQIMARGRNTKTARLVASRVMEKYQAPID